MDKAFYIGLGVAIVFGLLPFAVKEIPHWLTWLGIAIGVIIVIWALIKPIPSIINGPFALFMIGCACIAGNRPPDDNLVASPFFASLVTQRLGAKKMPGP